MRAGISPVLVSYFSTYLAPLAAIATGPYKTLTGVPKSPGVESLTAPMRGIDCELPTALFVRLSVAERVPLADAAGLKVNPRSQLPLVATGLVH